MNARRRKQYNYDPATSSKKHGSKSRLEQIRRMQIVNELRAERSRRERE